MPRKVTEEHKRKGAVDVVAAGRTQHARAQAGIREEYDRPFDCTGRAQADPEEFLLSSPNHRLNFIAPDGVDFRQMKLFTPLQVFPGPAAAGAL